MLTLLQNLIVFLFANQNYGILQNLIIFTFANQKFGILQNLIVFTFANQTYGLLQNQFVFTFAIQQYGNLIKFLYTCADVPEYHIVAKMPILYLCNPEILARFGILWVPSRTDSLCFTLN